MKRWDLWKHQQACEYRPCTEANTGINTHVQLKAKLMLTPSIMGSDNERLNKIIAAMKNDSIARIVAHDSLIKQFGSMLVERQGGKDAQFTSQKMRELARLVLRKMNLSSYQILSKLKSLTPL